jgi:hypothetical protein
VTFEKESAARSGIRILVPGRPTGPSAMRPPYRIRIERMSAAGAGSFAPGSKGPERTARAGRHGGTRVAAGLCCDASPAVTADWTPKRGPGLCREVGPSMLGRSSQEATFTKRLLVLPTRQGLPGSPALTRSSAAGFQGFTCWLPVVASSHSTGLSLDLILWSSCCCRVVRSEWSSNAGQ